MKKAASLLIVGGLVFGLSACGGGGGNAGSGQSSDQGTAGSSSSQSADQGNTTKEASGAKPIFEKHCASCHGKNLQGKVGPKLANIGSKLSKKQILNQIKNGTPGQMPGGLIKGAKAEKVATWLAGMK